MDMNVLPSALHWSAACITCALTGITPVTSKVEPIRFIAVGDMPYSSQEKDALQTKLKAAIAAAEVPFIVHYGDFKAGNDSCSDALFAQSKATIESLHPQVFYTPGDNDWTDCDRPTLLEPKSELERLDTLRSIFFDEASSGMVARQAGYPENARWWHDGVLFITIHMVGTNNGRTEVLQDNPQTAIAQVAARDQANQTWLSEAFSEAQTNQAQSIVITMQADISESNGEPCRADQGQGCDAYAFFREQLRQASAAFTRPDQTQKPVLLIHGDTYPYCWDKTFGGEAAPNLWRLNAWGDFQQPADVTLISVQPNQPNRPFGAATLAHQIEPERCPSP